MAAVKIQILAFLLLLFFAACTYGGSTTPTSGPTTMPATSPKPTTSTLGPNDLTTTDYIIIGVTCGVFVILIVGGIVFCCLQKKKARLEKDRIYDEYMARTDLDNIKDHHSVSTYFDEPITAAALSRKYADGSSRNTPRPLSVDGGKIGQDNAAFVNDDQRRSLAREELAIAADYSQPYPGQPMHPQGLQVYPMHYPMMQGNQGMAYGGLPPGYYYPGMQMQHSPMMLPSPLPANASQPILQTRERAPTPVGAKLEQEKLVEKAVIETVVQNHQTATSNEAKADKVAANVAVAATVATAAVVADDAATYAKAAKVVHEEESPMTEL